MHPLSDVGRDRERAVTGFSFFAPPSIPTTVVKQLNARPLPVIHELAAGCFCAVQLRACGTFLDCRRARAEHFARSSDTRIAWLGLLGFQSD